MQEQEIPGFFLAGCTSLVVYDGDDEIYLGQKHDKSGKIFLQKNNLYFVENSKEHKYSINFFS